MRCEGMRRYGAFVTGCPSGWQQCKNDAVSIITVEQNGNEPKDFLDCNECILECVRTEEINVVCTKDIFEVE